MNKKSEINAVIISDAEGQRIDKYLVDHFEALNADVSRSQIQQWIKDGAVLINGRAVKANYKLVEKDQLELTIPQEEEAVIAPENIPLNIVYEDDAVIVVNKPRGLVVHPAAGHHSNTLVNALLYHCKQLSQIGGEDRQGIVHRIDKDTSGLIVAAKNDAAHEALAKQLMERSVERKYFAIVHGIPEHDSGTIDAPIGRHPSDRKKYTVTNKNSKEAVTHFAVIERFKDAALMECQLETGRTHQIRVHLKFIGHPIVGDPVYGRNRRKLLDGQALHAAGLSFDHPATGERMRFEAPMPADMVSLLHYFRGR